MNILNIDVLIEILIKCSYLDITSFSRISIKYYNMVNDNRVHILNKIHEQKLNKGHGNYAICEMNRWFHHELYDIKVLKQHSIVYGKGAINLTEQIIIFDDFDDGYYKTVYTKKRIKYEKKWRISLVHNINYIMEFYKNYFNKVDHDVSFLCTPINYGYNALSEQKLREYINECLFICDLVKVVWDKTYSF